MVARALMSPPCVPEDTKPCWNFPAVHSHKNTQACVIALPVNGTSLQPNSHKSAQANVTALPIHGTVCFSPCWLFAASPP